MPTPYIAKAGDTLNSIAASQGFKNYKEAGITSVPSGNFDLIRPGDTINFGNSPSTAQTKTLVEPGVYKTPTGYVDNNGKSIPYKPIIQTTTTLDKKDQNIGIKIDALGNPQGNTGTYSPATNGSPTNPNTEKPVSYKTASGVAVSETPVEGSYTYKTPTTLQAGEKVGYGMDGKRYIIGKDGTVKNDAFADQEYQANEKEITKERERTALFDSLKSNLDTAHATLLDSIKNTFAIRRSKMEDINTRYNALKTNEGFSSNQARYMSDVNNGVLRDTEEKGEMRLMEIDAQEKELIAQAVQAKSTKDFELATKRMNELDALAKEKADTIQAVYKAAVDFNKALDEQAKELRLKEKEQFDQGTKVLTASAPALLKGYDSLKSQDEKIAFLQNYAKRLGVPTEMLLGTIEDERGKSSKESAEIARIEAQTGASERSNRPKASTTVDEFGNETATLDEKMSPEEQVRVQKEQDFFGTVDKMVASAFKNKAGVPVVTDKGYITHEAFKDLWGTAQKQGISRDAFLTRLQAKINLSTFSGAKKGYGLTDAEYTKLKKSNN